MTTQHHLDEAIQPEDTDATATEMAEEEEYHEEPDWLDRTVAYLKPRPQIWGSALVAIIVIVVLILHNINLSQPLGTDPTVAGRPLSNPDQHLHSLAIDPVHPGTVYLGTHYGLFTSTNDGATWPEKRGQFNTLMIISMAVSPLAPHTLAILGVEPNLGQDSVYITHDGHTWAHAADPSGTSPNTQRYLVAAGSTIHEWFMICDGVGVFRTADDGQTWKLLRAPASNQDDQRAIWQSPTNPQVLLVGGTLGLALSQDGGATWSSIALGSNQQDGVHSIVSSPASPGDVSISADDGVYHSADGGQTWARTSGIVSNAPFTLLTISHQHANILYGLVGNQVWRSADGGVTWNQQSALQTSFPSALIVAPDNDQHLYAGFYSPPNAVESLDGGQTWHVIAS